MKNCFADFDGDDLLDAAARTTGFNDLGNPDFEIPFRLLIDALNHEARLSALGKFVTRADLLKLLSNRIHMVQDRKTHPEMTHQIITRPLFIAGMPRTGSSLLHTLLALDPNHRAPLYWEVLYPSPPPNQNHTSDRRIAKAERDFRWFHRLAPDYRKIYRYGAENVAECIALQAMSFESLRFVFTYHVPTYLQWAQTHTLTYGYAFHREFLQHLQIHFPTKKWILKAPAHILHLNTLFETYPDAAVVFTHRNPTVVIPSMANNTYTLRKTFSRKIDAHQVAQEELNRWHDGWCKVKPLREIHEASIYDLMYDDFIHDPVKSIEKIYHYFCLPFSEEFKKSMENFLRKNRQHKYGKHRYDLSQFGLNEIIIKERFADYISSFDLT